MTITDLIERIRKSPAQQSLFHFTDARNLDPIKQDGLLSRRTLTERRIAHIPGGNDLSRNLDDHHGYDDYVHLCFRRQHGMAFQATNDKRIGDVCWLAVDPQILGLPGVLLSPDNSVKTNVEVVPAATAVDSPAFDFDILCDRTDWSHPEIQARLKAAGRYEILVPKAVPLPYIRF